MGPALPRPYQARAEAGEEVPLYLVVAVVRQMKLMAVMTVAEMLHQQAVAAAATMPAAGMDASLAVASACGGQRNCGNGGKERMVAEWHGSPGG